MADLTEREEGLVRSAVIKRMDKMPLSQAEERAVKKFEKAEAEKRRWAVYESIPKKDFVAMTGRQVKVLNEQAARYGLPMGGATIHLPNFLSALSGFLAKHWARFEKEIDQDALMTGGNTPALEQYRTHKAELARLDVLARKRELLPREEVRAGMLRVAAVYRESSAILVRMFGPEAAKVLADMNDDALAEVEQMFGDTQE